MLLLVLLVLPVLLVLFFLLPGVVKEPQEPCWSAGLGVAALDSGQGRGQVVLGRGGPDLIVSCWIPTFDSPLVVETCTLGSTLSSTVVVVMATSTSGLADGTAKFISTVVVGMATSTSGLADGTANFSSTGVLWTATLAATLVCGLVDLVVFSLAAGISGVGERRLLWSGKEYGLTRTVWPLTFIVVLWRIRYVPMMLLYFGGATDFLISSWLNPRHFIFSVTWGLISLLPFGLC